MVRVVCFFLALSAFLSTNQAMASFCNSSDVMLSAILRDAGSTLTLDTNKSGCCSWHGGVCGCYMGRAQCCDGQPSPTCGC